MSPDALRAAGQAFEALFLDAFDSADWHEGRRVTGGAGKDLRRRPEMHSLQRIGAVLAKLGREKPDALRVLLAELEAWAFAQCDAPRCLLSDAQEEKRQGAEADAALLAVLGAARSRVGVERAVRELAEQIASAKNVLVALQQQRPALAERVVVPRVLAAAGLRR